VKIAHDAFVRWLAERAPPENLRELPIDDLYLACACAEQDPAALASFDTQFIAPAGRAARRAGDPDDLVAEIQQRLRERLLAGPDARIRQYRGDGPLAGWVATAALRMAMNLRRNRATGQRAHQQAAREIPPPSDPEIDILRRQYGEKVESALEDALRSLDAEQRYLLRLHYVDGIPLHKIGTLRRADKSTVSRWLSRARAELLKETRRTLTAELGVGYATLDSLLGHLASNLDISISRILRPGRE
jgi:RNA polymerase sigma-70 factor (ECF subfamily)